MAKARPAPIDVPEHAKAHFWAKVDVRGPADCWEWKGPKDKFGYAKTTVLGRKGDFNVHRLAMHFATGGVPVDLVVDHLCRNHGCVNPAHLEAVTCAENIRRGLTGQNRVREALARTHCCRGHEMTPENSRPRDGGAGRLCIKCVSIRNRWAKERRHAREAAALAKGDAA